MQTTYRFKLNPSLEQDSMMESWLSMIRAQVNFNLADRIDSYNQGFIQDNFCDLKTKGEACPLTCSVNKSASVGYPWKSEDPSKRRSKQTISSPKIKLGLLLCLELGNVLDKGEWQESQKKKKKEQLFVLPFGYISTLYLLDLCWKDKGARFNPRRSSYPKGMGDSYLHYYSGSRWLVHQYLTPRQNSSRCFSQKTRRTQECHRC